MTDPPIGLVLAGGLGRRLGRSKGEVILAGSTLATRAARVLEPLCRGVLISVRRGAANPAPGYAALADAPSEGRGPLAGIDAAFAAVPRADVLVLACDYPRVEADLLRELLAASRPKDDVVLPVDAAGRDHPLVALWRGHAAAAVTAALATDRFEVGAVVRSLDARRLGAAVFPEIDLERALLNVNAPDDLDRL